MAAPKVPNEILQYLTCKNCFKWLNVAPIAVLENGSSICGRCEIHSNVKISGSLYEQLSSQFTFPCVYWREHCTEALTWTEVSLHEKRCIYKSKCKSFFIEPSTLFKPRKKKMDFNDEVVYIKMHNRLLLDFMCTFCQGYLACAPIYIDGAGHKICHRCFSSRNIEGYVRHAALEHLLGISVYPCIYRTAGCPEYKKFGEDYRVHEEDCSYGAKLKKPLRQHSENSLGNQNGHSGPNSPNQRRESYLKERGIIESHRGYIYGTITPNLVAKNKSNYPIHVNQDYDLLQKELTEKAKQLDEEIVLRIPRPSYWRQDSRLSRQESKISRQESKISRQESTNQNMNHENMNYENMNQEGMNQKSINEESITKESVNKENANKESTNKESLNKESSNKESVNIESVNKENLIKESVNKGSVRKESVSKENLNKESVNVESISEESINHDSTKKISIQSGTSTIVEVHTSNDQAEGSTNRPSSIRILKTTDISSISEVVDEEYYENLQDMYLSHGHPGIKRVMNTNLNRTGSFADSSIKPKINPRESYLKTQPTYNDLIEELKHRQSLRADKERY